MALVCMTGILPIKKYGEHSVLNGYNVNGISIYNPKSVVSVILKKSFDNYWSKTETYEALKIYIKRNENALRDRIIRMIAGEHISVNTRRFQNDMCTFESADDVLTLLVHLNTLKEERNQIRR